MTDFKRIFNPRRLAIVGVSADDSSFSFGTGILHSLLRIGYEGTIYPVNPKGGTLNGLTIYSRVEDIPETIDFAIIAVAARLVPEALEACRQKGAAGAEILSSGFRELGSAEGNALESEIKQIVEKGIRVIGPNCFGVYSPKSGLTFLPGPDLSRESGGIAFVSQSGGMAVDVASTGKWFGLKFSTVISIGNGADVRESELLSYFTNDPATDIIAMYIEGVENGEVFFNTLKSAAARKPVIILKGGLSEAGSRAVASHTASMSGRRIIWQSVLRQAGAVQVERTDEAVQLCLGFSMLPPHPYRGVSVVGGGGALGVAACDTADSYNLKIPPFDRPLAEKIMSFLPKPGSSAANPIDVANPFVSPAMLKNVLLSAAEDDRIDIQVLVQLLDHYKVLAMSLNALDSLDDLTPYRELSQVINDVTQKTGKPVVLVMPRVRLSTDDLDMEKVMRNARRTFLDQGIPVYDTLADAFFTISQLSDFSRRRAVLNSSQADHKPAASMPDPDGAAEIIQSALTDGRQMLSEYESKKVLAAFTIPTTREILAANFMEAKGAAATIGFPVAVKGCSPEIAHKSESQLIRLNVKDDAELDAACHAILNQLGDDGQLLIQEMIDGKRELVVGVNRDDQFGPCVMFGLGGIFTELLNDVTFRKAPLTRQDARDMIREIRGHRILDSVRGLPQVDEEALVSVLTAVGRLVTQFDCIREIDINPLIIRGNQPVVVDALIALDSA